MKLRVIMASLALLAAPTLAAAGCSWHQNQAMSCAEGMVLDEETGVCVKQATS
ncbi:hypothetical protein SAMN04490248_10955 [Salinihabitans flavidus]|uniref:Chitin binding Peritrophin-A domain-containing protein n=1 Tax=Salinihabitans flavidus TaxID=569882 RepID=A0A1H8RNT2_9RHOB|nr:hypothetical protein [Salinihabitans flavidus]SEO67824.1 hypothetical protein SAMN04490248_10955 [Salinihabitans flavidus]